MRRIRPAPWVVVLLVFVWLAGVACGGDGDGGGGDGPAARPSSTARLAIFEPANGAAFSGPTIPVQVSLEGAEVTDRVSTDLRPDMGHLHVSLDGTLVEMNYRLDGQLDDVTAGTHVLRVEFVALDHAPFNPRVFAEVAFEVGS